MSVKRHTVEKNVYTFNSKDITEAIDELSHELYRLAFVYNTMDEDEFDDLMYVLKTEATEKGKHYSQAPNWIRVWDGRLKK